MSKREPVDVEFEVITPAIWSPEPRVRRNHPIRWVWFGFLLFIAGFTLLMGLNGADLDTRDTGNATHMEPDGPIPIPPVPRSPITAN